MCQKLNILVHSQKLINQKSFLNIPIRLRILFEKKNKIESGFATDPIKVTGFGSAPRPALHQINVFVNAIGFMAAGYRVHSFTSTNIFRLPMASSIRVLEKWFLISYEYRVRVPQLCFSPQ